MARAAVPTASMPEAHSRLSVTPGTDVGSTISAEFINNLPPDLKHWYAQPAGLTQSRSGELVLPGTESMCGGAAAADQGAGGADKKKKK